MLSSQDSQRDPLNTALIIITCFSTTALSAFCVSGPSIALPAIGHDVSLSQNELQWICSAFALSSGCFLLLFGRLADIHGRKLIFLIGTAITGIFSLACGFARTKMQIIIFRGLQGMGSAASVPAALGILAHSFPPSLQRSIAFSVFSAGNPFGSGLGYILGAIAGQYSTVKWRSIFFIGSGIAVLSFIGALLVFENDRPTSKGTDRKVDWLGAFFITTGLACILFVLGQGGVSIPGLDSGWIVFILIMGLIQITLFVLCEYYLAKRSTRPPLMRLGLWGRANGKFAAMQGIAFFEWCAFMSWMIWVQLYYQLYKGYTPVHTMLRLLPMSITGFILNAIVGLVVSRVDVLWLVVTGTLATSFGCLLFAVINPSAPFWAFGFPASILAVWGVDFIFACGTLFVARVSRKEEQSLAGGVFQTVAQLGKAFGLAITTNVYNSVVVSETEHGKPGDGPASPTSLKAFKAAQWTGFTFAILAFILALIFLCNVGIVGHHQTSTDLSKLELETQSQTPNSTQSRTQHSLNTFTSQEDFEDQFGKQNQLMIKAHCISCDSLIDAKLDSKLTSDSSS